MKVAVFAGSFDPFTLGHLDIAKRASKMFDKIYILIAINPNKSSRFSLETRLNIIKDSCFKIKNIEVAYTNGLTVDFARNHNAKFLIRGYRNEQDLVYENNMAAINKELAPEIETIILPSKKKLSFVSSTKSFEEKDNLKELIKLIPKEAIKYINNK